MIRSRWSGCTIDSRFLIAPSSILGAFSRSPQWKLVFAEQRSRTFRVWSDPFVPLRLPKLFNLRTDPFERADTDANNYDTWWIRRVFTLAPAQTFVGKFVATFKDYPQRQKSAKFNVDDVFQKLNTPAGGN